MKNGIEHVHIQTINGKFSFNIQRYCTRGRSPLPSILSVKKEHSTNIYRSSEVDKKACYYGI
jgi:hypothetical protein